MAIPNPTLWEDSRTEWERASGKKMVMVPDLDEVAKIAVSKLAGAKIIDPRLAKVTTEFLTLPKKKWAAKPSVLLPRYKQITNLLQWLFDNRNGDRPVKGPVTPEQLGRPPTEARPGSEGYVDCDTISRFYSDMQGEGQKVAPKSLIATVKKYIVFIDGKGAMRAPTTEGVRDCRTTSEPARKDKGYPLNYNELDLFFKNLLFGVKDYQKLFCMYLLETGLRPDHAYKSLRVSTLEAAGKQMAEDCTREKYHVVDITESIDEGFRREGKTEPEERKIKAYPRTVYISPALFKELMAYVQRDDLVVQPYDEKEGRPQKTYLKRYTEMNADEKAATWVFGRMEDPDRLGALITRRMEKPEKYGIPREMQGKFLMYSLRKTWATTVARLAGVETVILMQNWSRMQIPIQDYIRRTSYGDAWMIKSRYGIFISSDDVTQDQVRNYRAEAARTMIERSLENVITQGLPEEAVYEVLGTAGVAPKDAIPILKRASEYAGTVGRKVFEIPTEEEVTRKLEAGTKALTITERIEQLQRSVAEVAGKCTAAATEAVETAHEEAVARLEKRKPKGGEEAKKALMTGAEETYRSIRSKLETEIERRLKEGETK